MRSLPKKHGKKVNPKVYALEIIGNLTHRQDGYSIQYPIRRVPFVKRWGAGRQGKAS